MGLKWDPNRGQGKGTRGGGGSVKKKGRRAGVKYLKHAWKEGVGGRGECIGGASHPTNSSNTGGPNVSIDNPKGKDKLQSQGKGTSRNRTGKKRSQK